MLLRSRAFGLISLGLLMIILMLLFIITHKSLVNTHVPLDNPLVVKPLTNNLDLHTIAPINSYKPVNSTELQAEQRQDYDLVIIGSELEGMYMARAAADEGLKVIVLDPRPAPGGQLLQGEMLFLDEPWDTNHKSLLQGRVKLLFDDFKKGSVRTKAQFTSYFNALSKQIPIVSGIELVNVQSSPEGNTKQTVSQLSYKTKDGILHDITAAYWVDNTDFGALTGFLKTTQLPGLEQVYGLKHPEYMAGTYILKFKNVDWSRFKTEFNVMDKKQRALTYGYGNIDNTFALGFTRITNGYRPTNTKVFLRGMNALYQGDGQVLINALLVYGIDPSNPSSIEEGLQLGRKESPLIANYLRKSMIGWEKAELNFEPSYLYIREYKHYESEYVLQVSDLLGGAMFWDNVSIGGYPIDLQGTQDVKWGLEAGRPDKYGMPLRSFILKDYSNVLLAGKNVGASAIAYGSARIQANTSLAAESIGVILGQIHHKKKLADLNAADLLQLQAYLSTRYGIKLTGVVAQNKIKNWSPEAISKLNSGKLIYPPPHTAPAPSPVKPKVVIKNKKII